MTPIPETIALAAASFGSAVAVSDGTHELSFAEVDARSNRLANALLALSPAHGARVAILTPNRLESVELDFAIAKAGKVRVPVNTRLSTEERAYILQDSGAEALVFDATEAPFVAAVKERLGLAHVIAMGADVPGALSYDRLVSEADDAMPRVPLEADDASFILYTSGTTGRPKGATATQASRWAATRNMLEDEIDARPGDAMVHVGSMAHGSGSKVLAYFMCGARNIAVAKFDANGFLDLVERERATASFLVPTMISMLLEARRTNTADLSSLKTITYGGAPIAPAVLREALTVFGNVFVQVYGSCEAPHPVLVLRPEDHVVGPGDEVRLSSVGRVTSGCEVMVADADGNQVPTGTKGEMWIRGANVMCGYWENPVATSEVMVDGWYRTGDVATCNDEGYFHIVDRERDMIISGGLNVYPAEVEAALHAHPAVLECAVFGVPDSAWGEAVQAAVVLREGAEVTEVDLIDHCREVLAGYKKPRSVAFLPELPKGPTGKILKRALRDPYWAGEARAV
ncbi:MAG: AMP-dependent synthetase and ligase [Actinomycetia bacterium]|nr:AMP-dependent synthetase and ligase [Actinomycetes bacterium]